MLRVSDVTRILDAIQHGDRQAADQLPPIVYGELRKLAASRMDVEAPIQDIIAFGFVSLFHRFNLLKSVRPIANFAAGKTVGRNSYIAGR
jgi:hypothetical protein